MRSYLALREHRPLDTSRTTSICSSKTHHPRRPRNLCLPNSRNLHTRTTSSQKLCAQRSGWRLNSKPSSQKRRLLPRHLQRPHRRHLHPHSHVSATVHPLSHLPIPHTLGCRTYAPLCYRTHLPCIYFRLNALYHLHTIRNTHPVHSPLAWLAFVLPLSRLRIYYISECNDNVMAQVCYL